VGGPALRFAPGRSQKTGETRCPSPEGGIPNIGFSNRPLGTKQIPTQKTTETGRIGMKKTRFEGPVGAKPGWAIQIPFSLGGGQKRSGAIKKGDREGGRAPINRYTLRPTTEGTLHVTDDRQGAGPRGRNWWRKRNPLPMDFAIASFQPNSPVFHAVRPQGLCLGMRRGFFCLRRGPPFC